MHHISLAGVTISNFHQLIPPIALQTAVNIVDNMPAENKDRLCQIAVALALQGHLARHIPFVGLTDHGRGMTFVCNTLLDAGGLDLSLLTRVTDINPFK